MPTFNQLVRKGRQTTTKKSTAPALQKVYSTCTSEELQLFTEKNFRYVFSTEERCMYCC